MTLPIVYQLAASGDVTDTMAAYEAVKLGLGLRFYEQVKGRLLLAASQPKIFGVIYRQVRAVKVPNFPYVIYYRAHATRIEVIAVVHGSRDASVWQSRK